MLSSLTIRLRSLIWFLLFTFTLYCMPHLELLLPYEIRFFTSEARAAEAEAPEPEGSETSLSPLGEGKGEGGEALASEESSAISATGQTSEAGGSGSGVSVVAPENLLFTGAATYMTRIGLLVADLDQN